MSVYFENVKTFSKKYHSGLMTRIKFFLLYPLFKISWLADFSKNALIRNISKFIIKLVEPVTIKIPLPKSGLQVPISFERYDLANFRELFFGDEYNFSVEDKIDSYIDLGANTGYSILLLCERFTPTKVIAVEANPQLIPHIESKIPHHKLRDSIVVENLAIFPGEDSQVTFHVAPNHRDSKILFNNEEIDGGETLTVKTMSLASLFKKYHLETLDFLKIDIEGGEYPLLQHEAETFKKIKHIFAEVHGEREKRDKFARDLEALGFEVIGRNGCDPIPCETAYFKNSTT